MDLDLNDDQQALQEMISRFAADRFDIDEAGRVTRIEASLLGADAKASGVIHWVSTDRIAGIDSGSSNSMLNPSHASRPPSRRVRTRYSNAARRCCS